MQKRKAAPHIAESITPLYRVVFDTCGPFVAGEVAHASALGDDKGLAYLLRIGAVVPVEPICPHEVGVPVETAAAAGATS